MTSPDGVSAFFISPNVSIDITKGFWPLSCISLSPGLVWFIETLFVFSPCLLGCFHQFLSWLLDFGVWLLPRPIHHICLGQLNIRWKNASRNIGILCNCSNWSGNICIPAAGSIWWFVWSIFLQQHKTRKGRIGCVAKGVWIESTRGQTGGGTCLTSCRHLPPPQNSTVWEFRFSIECQTGTNHFNCRMRAAAKSPIPFFPLFFCFILMPAPWLGLEDVEKHVLLARQQQRQTRWPRRNVLRKKEKRRDGFLSISLCVLWCAYRLVTPSRRLRTGPRIGFSPSGNSALRLLWKESRHNVNWRAGNLGIVNCSLARLSNMAVVS